MPVRSNLTKDEVSNAFDKIYTYLENNWDSISRPVKEEAIEVLKILKQRKDEFEKEKKPEPKVPKGAHMLWVLARGNPETFANYLSTYPDPELNAISQDPEAVAKLIEALKQEVPEEAGYTDQQGLSPPPQKSSTVQAMAYDPQQQKLKVKFHGVRSNPTSEYDGVDPLVASSVAKGAHAATTKGKNRWGEWWKGKTPSTGSALDAFVKKGGYPYKKVS